MEHRVRPGSFINRTSELSAQCSSRQHLPSMTADERPSGRYCLITVGATVGFEQLTKAALEPSFWQFLRDKGFSNLRIQCGPDIPWATDKLSQLEHEIPPGFSVDVFDVRKNLMLEEMVLCKPAEGQRGQGLIISHAGE